MRIALLSDIHSNLVALEAVLAAAGAVDGVWHLGDVVGYGPEPDAVVERLAEIGAVGVRGNHDAVAVGAEGAEYFNPDARRAVLWTRDTISPLTRDRLTTLPETLEVAGLPNGLDALDGLGTRLTLVHGSPRAPIWEYITSAPIALAGLDVLGTGSACFGHTHVPAIYRLGDGELTETSPRDGTSVRFDGDRLLLNPGSVGQPRDGDPRASFAILDTEAGTVTWRRVAYDIRATQAAMRARGLPDRLVTRLELGY